MIFLFAANKKSCPFPGSFFVFDQIFALNQYL